MLLLTTALNRISPYKQMLQVEREQRAAVANNTLTPMVMMCMKRGINQRRYNEPRHDEVAAIFVSNDGTPPIERDIVVYPCDQRPQNIS